MLMKKWSTKLLKSKNIKGYKKMLMENWIPTISSEIREF